VIIPVINKIDLPAADIDKTSDQIISLLGVDKDDICLISAKSGQGIEKLIETIIAKVPPPETKKEDVTRCLIFDSYYDDYRGVILYVRVFDGQVAKHDQIVMMATKVNAQALEIGVLSPDLKPEKVLSTGEIGYIVTNLKTTRDAKVGDT